MIKKILQEKFIYIFTGCLIYLFYAIYQKTIYQPLGFGYPEVGTSQTILNINAWIRDGIAQRGYALSWYLNDEIPNNLKYQYVSMPQLGFFAYYLLSLVNGIASPVFLKFISLGLLSVEILYLNKILSLFKFSNFINYICLVIYIFCPVVVLTNVQFIWSDTIGQLIFIIFIYYLVSALLTKNSKFLYGAFISALFGFAVDHVFIFCIATLFISLFYFNFSIKKKLLMVFLMGAVFLYEGFVILYIHSLTMNGLLSQMLGRFAARTGSNSDWLTFSHMFFSQFPYDFNWSFYPINIGIFGLLFLLYWVIYQKIYVLLMVALPYFLYLAAFRELHYVHDFFLKYLSVFYVIVLGGVLNYLYKFKLSEDIFYYDFGIFIRKSIFILSITAYIASTSFFYANSDHFMRFVAKNYNSNFYDIGNFIKRNDSNKIYLLLDSTFYPGDEFIISSMADKNVYFAQVEKNIDFSGLMNIAGLFKQSNGVETLNLITRCDAVDGSKRITFEGVINKKYCLLKY